MLLFLPIYWKPTALFISFQFQISIYHYYYYLSSHYFNSSFGFSTQASGISCMKYQFYTNNYILTTNLTEPKKEYERRRGSNIMFIYNLITIQMIKLINRRTFRQINNPGLYCWRSLAMISHYPYRFGGIASNTLPRQFTTVFELMFQKKTIEGLKQAYLSVLEALNNKQLQFLKGVMQNGLTKDLRFVQTQLVHPNQPIEVSVGKSFLTVGAEFQRTNENRKWISFPQQNSNQNYQLFMSPNLMGNVKNSQPNISILFGYQIYFKGKTKLIKKSQKKQDSIESHMIQFEISKNIGMMSLMSLMMKIQNTKSNDKSQQKIAKQLFSSLIGTDYQWKIGDMDGVLNKNFEIVSGGGGFGNLPKF